jgi:predicted nucleotidyltransferase
MQQKIKRPISRKTINDFITRIVDDVKPERIVLFGSYAYGKPTSDSDLDLIIIKQTDQPFNKRAKQIRQIFWGSGLPVDILVYTPDEYKQLKDDPFSLPYQANQEGIVLYG